MGGWGRGGYSAAVDGYGAVACLTIILFHFSCFLSLGLPRVQGAAAVAAALRPGAAMQNLQRLDMYENSVHDVGAMDLASAVEVSS